MALTLLGDSPLSESNCLLMVEYFLNAIILGAILTCELCYLSCGLSRWILLICELLDLEDVALTLFGDSPLSESNCLLMVEYFLNAIILGAILTCELCYLSCGLSRWILLICELLDLEDVALTLFGDSPLSESNCLLMVEYLLSAVICARL